MNVSKITVCGGGNGAQTLVPIASHNLQCPIDVYTPFADEVTRLRAGAAQGGIETAGAVQVKARPHKVSSDPAEVIPGSEVIVLVVPAFAHESVLRQIVPSLERNAWVGAMPARGGFDYCAAQVLRDEGREDVGIFGLQTLPWACRIREYGRAVHVLGIKKVVDAASRPAAKVAGVKLMLERMLGLPVKAAANLLSVTLANTGQLIHPGIMYGLFAEWDGTPFGADEVPLFYHGLGEEGARVLSGLSDEVQAIRVRLESKLDLSAVRPLKEWLLRSYGEAIGDPSSLLSAFVTNRAYTGLKAPVREVLPSQFIPDFQARYLTEDVPFGLAVSRAIASMADVETPVMDQVIGWASHRLGKRYLGQNSDEARIPQRYGLRSLEQLVAFAVED
ncbi:MAG: NAD/NADP octopine/nopaline dehydrogenase family protein [Anaerolineae bacterium]